MNYIYLGLGDFYLPATASALHLGQLDRNFCSQSQLQKIKYFRRGEEKDEGRLYYAGQDQAGNKVYLACVRSQPDVMVNALQSMLGIYGIPLNEASIKTCFPENPQVAGLVKLLDRLAMKSAKEWLSCRLVKNRFADLCQISDG